MGEHLPCKQGVKGSNPSISIRMQKHRILLCTLKIAYRKYKISLTQKIQDIREKTKMFVNTNEPKTNACNAIQVGTKTVIRRSYASCSYPLLRK